MKYTIKDILTYSVLLIIEYKMYNIGNRYIRYLVYYITNKLVHKT